MKTELLTIDQFFDQLKQEALNQRKKKVGEYSFKFAIGISTSGLTSVEGLADCPVFTDDEKLNAYIGKTFTEKDNYAIFGFTGSSIKLISNIIAI